MFKKIIFVAIVIISLGISAFTEDEILIEKEVKAAVYEPFVVLELFTSQGCSSCPSADKLLNKVKREPGKNIFALSYHVDYWNYIGWKDPYSKKDYAAKQSRYNAKIGYRGNYTPEVVVNGKEHFVGSSTSKMYSKIDFYSGKKAENEIKVTNIAKNKKSIALDYEILGNTDHKKLRAVLVLDERTTVVKRGENRNRTLTNSNIVVSEKYIDIAKSGNRITIAVPEIVKPGEKMELMLFLENNDLRITGAVKSKVIG